MVNPACPEMGQSVFEVSVLELECPAHVGNVLDALQSAWDVFRPGTENPFSNTGSRFDGKHCHVHAYSWSDENQTWNFKWHDVEVRWYKYLGRSMSTNRDVTVLEAMEMLKECFLEISDGAPGKESA